MFRHPAIAIMVLAAALPGLAAAPAPIDRHALVSRHNPVVERLDTDAPLSVGNGGFAFTADITGLQTFAALYQRTGVPTETQARWAWHTGANPQHYTLQDAMQPYTAFGRTVDYPTNASGPAGEWLRRNPHDVPLGQIGLELAQNDGAPLAPDDVQNPRQTLDLWTGVIRSHYELAGVPVRVETACHPGLDLVAIRIESDLVATGRLRVVLAFPRGYDRSVKNTPPLDWSHPELHRTAMAGQRPGRVDLARTIDDTHYQVAVAWTGEASLRETAPASLHPGRRTAGSGPCRWSWPSRRWRCRRRCRTWTPRWRRAPRTGPTSGAAAPRWTSPAAAIRAPGGWRSASSFPNT